MFKKILIANRGEIAVRIIRACREIGVATVAVYSEADRNSLHVDLADETVCIGPARARDSYLNTKNIISATVLTGAEAIHPGFGFLAENSKFAEMCKACHIAFIGPDPEVIEMMGNKAKARQIMGQAGVPIVPGIEGVLANFKQAEASAERIGYPVMLKASAGGGGKGIRIVWSRDELKKAYDMAKKKLRLPLMMIQCIWRNIWWSRDISNFRSWRTTMEMSFTLEKETVQSSAEIKKSLKRLLQPS